MRAAVEEFEERVRSAGKRKKSEQGGGGKRRNGSGVLMGGIDVGGEKIDGRAGPKSEAVVLGKSRSFFLVSSGLVDEADCSADGTAVDHIRTLLASRATLLEQLSAAYAQAGNNGTKVEAGRRVWDEHWDETPMAIPHATNGDDGEPDGEPDEGEWSEDD